MDELKELRNPKFEYSPAEFEGLLEENFYSKMEEASKGRLKGVNA